MLNEEMFHLLVIFFLLVSLLRLADPTRGVTSGWSLTVEWLADRSKMVWSGLLWCVFNFFNTCACSPGVHHQVTSWEDEKFPKRIHTYIQTCTHISLDIRTYTHTWVQTNKQYIHTCSSCRCSIGSFFRSIRAATVSFVSGFGCFYKREYVASHTYSHAHTYIHAHTSIIQQSCMNTYPFVNRVSGSCICKYLERSYARVADFMDTKSEDISSTGIVMG